MTQVCADCGAPTEVDEDFCGECGAYLEWDERAAAAAEPVAEPVATPAPEAAPPKLSLIRRVVAPLTDAVDRSPAPVPPAAPALPPQARTVVPPTPGVPPASPPTSPPPAGLPPAPQDGHPAPVQPGVAAPKPTRRPERDTQPLQPGDVICGQCGAGNKPTRKFCRRCGHDLTDAPVVKVPWWRRLLARRPKTREAGSRPRRVRTSGRSALGLPRRLITMLAIIGIIGGGGYFARGYVRDASGMVLDRVKGTEPVNPTGMTASNSQPGHGPRAARDGENDSYWAPAKSGSGKGEFLVTKFEDPFRLVYILITPGVHGAKDSAYLKSGRPRELRLVLTSEDGSDRVKTIELDDKVGPDQFNVTGNNITEVKIEIVSSYPGSVSGSHTGIAEVEFHARK